MHLALVAARHHTQFRESERHTERRVIGVPAFPGQAPRSLALMFAVAGVLFLLGGLVQINPIWLWGPYHVGASTNGAQPDWYLGWLIGALRLVPGWDLVIDNRTVVPNPFWGGVLFPGIVFGLLYLWPTLERRLTRDRATHNLAERPRDNPWRTAIGAALISWVFLIFLAGSADRVNVLFGLDYTPQIEVYRVAIWVIPVIVLIVTRRVCIELVAGEAVARIRQEAAAQPPRRTGIGTCLALIGRARSGKRGPRRCSPGRRLAPWRRETGGVVALGYALSSEELGPQQLVANAVAAERAGFAYALVSDHFHPWLDVQGESPFVWSTIGALSQATRSLAVGTGVTCPLIRLHPAIVAQAAATSAALMPGRFFLGVGTGENLNEHVLGDRWPSHEERVEMLEEAVSLIRELWRGGLVSHRGAALHGRPRPSLHASGRAARDRRRGRRARTRPHSPAGSATR